MDALSGISNTHEFMPASSHALLFIPHIHLRCGIISDDDYRKTGSDPRSRNKMLRILSDARPCFGGNSLPVDHLSHCPLPLILHCLFLRNSSASSVPSAASFVSVETSSDSRSVFVGGTFWKLLPLRNPQPLPQPLQQREDGRAEHAYSRSP